MNDDSYLTKSLWVRWLLHGVGGGSAIALGLAVIKAVEKRPEFLPQLLGGNVLFFVALVVGMMIFDRRLQSYAELHARAVRAQEQLAFGVNALVAKDDQREREQEILLDHLARQTEKILAHLEARAGAGT